MPGGHDLRRRLREGSNCKVVVVWRDEHGTDKFANGRAQDVSDIGLRLMMPTAIPVGAYITVRCEELGIHGRASVRYCHGRGAQFTVGVEFSAGLTRTKPLKS